VVPSPTTGTPTNTAIYLLTLTRTAVLPQRQRCAPASRLLTYAGVITCNPNYSISRVEGEKRG
jgi:hypothetical protein